MQTDVMSVYVDALATLDKQVAGLQGQYRPFLQCQKGCSSCCKDTFKVRYIEALRLMQGFFEASPEVQQAIIENLQNPTEVEEERRCPVLVNDACALYDYRPTLCRAYGLMVQLRDSVSTCPLNFLDLPEEKQITVLDIGPYYDLFNDLSELAWQVSPHAANQAEAPTKTIREFFHDFLQPSEHPL